MLACLGIKLLHFDLSRRGALVLRRGVKMPGTGTGFKLDLFAHFPASLNVHATGANLEQHRIDTVLVDGAQRCIGQAQADPAIFTFNPEAAP